MLQHPADIVVIRAEKLSCWTKPAKAVVDAQVQCKGLRMLCNVASREEVIPLPLRVLHGTALHGLVATTTLVRIDVGWCACATRTHMQANDKSRLEIVAQGGIDAVQRSMTLHQDNAEVRVCIAPKSADATAFACSPSGAVEGPTLRMLAVGTAGAERRKQDRDCGCRELTPSLGQRQSTLATLPQTPLDGLFDWWTLLASGNVILRNPKPIAPRRPSIDATGSHSVSSAACPQYCGYPNAAPLFESASRRFDRKRCARAASTLC
jgi:hypothetical protein